MFYDKGCQEREDKKKYEKFRSNTEYDESDTSIERMLQLLGNIYIYKDNYTYIYH